MLTTSSSLATCVRAVREMRFEPAPSITGGPHLYRFTRADRAVVDVLAPDHTPPAWPLLTVGSKQTIQVDGGHQALSRRGAIAVTRDEVTGLVPVPDLLGATVLKAAAWLADSRDRERHSGDVAFLTSLMLDPIAESARFVGSDRRRLNKLDAVLGDRGAAERAALGPSADDAYTTWRVLLSS